MFGPSPICMKCGHFNDNGTCKAFPEKIPDLIFINGGSHLNPFIGDNGIQFEPRDEETQKSWDISITKTDSDQRLVFGWLSVAKDANGNQVVDLQGDMIDPEELEKAAIRYALDSREAGDSHKRITGIGKMVMQIVTTREIQKAMGIPEGAVPEGWFIGYHVDDDEVWKLIKSGDYKSFSIGGSGKRIPMGGGEQT